MICFVLFGSESPTNCCIEFESNMAQTAPGPAAKKHPLRGIAAKRLPRKAPADAEPSDHELVAKLEWLWKQQEIHAMLVKKRRFVLTRFKTLHEERRAKLRAARGFTGKSRWYDSRIAFSKKSFVVAMHMISDEAKNMVRQEKHCQARKKAQNEEEGAGSDRERNLIHQQIVWE